MDDQAYGEEIPNDDTVEVDQEADIPRPSRVSNPMFDFNLDPQPDKNKDVSIKKDKKS